METKGNNGKDDIKSELVAIMDAYGKFEELKMEEHGTNDFFGSMTSSPDYNKDWHEFAQEQEKKIDGLLVKVEPSDELHLKLTLSKGMLMLRGLAALQRIDKAKFLLTAEKTIFECQALLEPYKHVVDCVFLLIMCQMDYFSLIKLRKVETTSDSPELQADYQKLQKMIDDTDKLLETMAETEYVKSLGIGELFRTFGDTQENQLGSEHFIGFSKESIHQCALMAKMQAVQLAKEFNDVQSARKYEIDVLKCFLMFPNPKNRIIVRGLVLRAYLGIQSLIKDRYFEQAQHIAAVVMYTVVEYRRSMPKEERPTINSIQFEASYLFGFIGMQLFKSCFQLIFKDDFRDVETDFHDECVRLMPESEALHQYEKQFPSKLDGTEREFERIQNKVRQWVDRMEELERTNTGPFEVLTEIKKGLAMLKKITTLEVYEN